MTLTPEQKRSVIQNAINAIEGAQGCFIQAIGYPEQAIRPVRKMSDAVDALREFMDNLPATE